MQENVLKLKKILRFIPLNREQTKLAEEVFKKDYEIRNKKCKNKLQKIKRIQNRIQYLEIDKQIILKRLDLISNQVNGRKEWGM